MAFIITVSNAKGGVGKSSITYGLASYYAMNGARCGILDEDIQQTISDNMDMFKERGDKVKVKLIRKADISSYADLEDNEDFDIIFVDTPPVLTTQLEKIYDVSDMILIPIKPSTDDYKSLMKSIVYVREVMARNPNLVVAIVMNMVVRSSNIQKDFRKAFEGEERIVVLKSELANRVIHFKYKYNTHSLFKTKDKNAIKEMKALGDEIYKLLTQ